MWRMDDGHRCLTEPEWSAFSAGLGYLIDMIDDAVEFGDDSECETGVTVFDVLQPEQKLCLLADVARALRDTDVKAPHHTAANEGTIAAVIAALEGALDMELAADGTPDASTDVRTRLHAFLAATQEEAGQLPAPTDAETDEWGLAIELLESHILWDADYAMGDEFLDLPPEAARATMDFLSIDKDYFTTVPHEPTKQELAAARGTLANLLGRPAPTP
jgi:hypothetical protein